MRVKGIFVLLSLALMLVVPHLAMAANPIHYFDCKDCHKPGYAINQIDSNICLTCHGGSGASIAVTPRGPINAAGDFSTGDASDHYGNGAAIVGDQTSHNWAAPSTNPAAGASEPNRSTYPGFYSRYGTTVGTVACSRCHDPHAQYGTGNDKLLPLKADRTGPMAVNDMCIACHSDFDAAMQGNHGLLSHPMVDNYEAFAAITPNYKTGIAAYDPADPYATGARLVDGNITCLTCHGLHFTDSDDGTTDGPGQALNTGDGLMLRRDGTQILGASGQPTGGSICTECHDYEGAVNALHGANGGTKDVGCLACHGGHNYNDNNPTWYMLKESMVGYIGGAAPPATDAERNAAWVGSEGVVDGFCETCHGDITDWNAATDAGVGRDHSFATDATQCNTCHASHGEGSFSDAAGCNDCHGWPPADSTGGGPNATGYAIADIPFGGGPATNYNYLTNNGSATYLDEATTAHGTHALGNPNEYKFACNECHQGNTHNDISGTNPTFQDVFINDTGLLATTAGLSADYAGGTNTCSAVYCHSDGVNADRVIAGPNAVAIPTWASGTNTTCTSCHNTGTSGTATVHATHLALPALDGAAVTCGTCHDDTWASTNALKTNGDGTAIAAHVDGDVDVKFNTTLLPTAPMNQVAGTCAVYCHSNGTAPVQTPDWDDVATGDCGDCHAVTSGAGLLYAHDTHLDEGLACNDCHTHDGSAFGGDHINGTKDVTADVCNTCHGTTTGGTGVDAYPTFTDPNSVTCNTCHQGVLAVIGGTAPDASGTASNSHSDTCTTCHTDTADPDHLGGATTKRLIAADSNTTCNNCHGSGGSVVTMNGLVTHQVIDCASCHDPHYAGSNLSLVRPDSTNYSGTVVFTATTGANSYDEDDADNTDDICATCHTAGNQTTPHNNQTNAGVRHNEGTNCFSCHLPHTNPGNAFAIGGGDSCDSCHGYPPTTAAHALHAPDSAILDAGGKIYRDATNGYVDVSSCEYCHDGADLYTYNQGDDKISGTPGQENHGKDFPADGTQLAVLATTVGYDGSSCATACHDGATGVTAAWTDASLDCAACHYQAADPTQAGNTGDINTISDGHNAHFSGGGAVTCADCHAPVGDTTHITNRDGATELAKIQGMAVAVQNEATVIAAHTFETVGDTCSTASCHNDARPGNDVITPAWGADDPNCTQCHAAAPSTGSHTKHIPVATDCSDCHTSALQDTSYNSTNHFDGNIDVAVGNYTTDKAINSAFESCDAPSCHDDGRAPTLTPDWGTPVTTCLACHEAVPSTGSHASHVSAGAVCADCHTGAVQEDTPPTTGHRNGTIDVNAGGYPTDRALTSPFSTCNAAVCHQTGQAANDYAVTPTWGNAGNCATCHASDMATGSHTIHLANSAVCGDCHNGAIKDSNPGTAHIDTNIDVVAGYATANAAYGSATWTTCDAASCHDNGTGTLVTTPDWGTTANCTECHTTIPATGAHTTHLTQTISTAFTINCTDCHDGAVWGSSATTVGHRNDLVNVTGGYGYPATSVKGSSTYTQTCSTTYCHGDNMPKGTTSGTTNTPAWNANNADGCNFCHKMDDTAGSIPAHTGVVMTDCITCHDNANAAGDGFVDTSLHINGLLEGGGDSCSDCHFNVGTDVRASGAHAAHNTIAYTGALSTSDYGNAANGWYAVTYTNGVPSFACGYCHPSTVAGHMTKQVSLDPTQDANASGTVKAMNDGSAAYALGVCSATYCHSDGVNVAAGVSPNWTTGSISGNCTDCHGNTPTTGAHSSHEVGIHYEELYDKNNGGLLSATGTVGSGAAHGDTDISSTISCFTCHKDTVTDSANATNTTCGSCHTDSGTVIDGNDNARILTTSSTHLNGVKDVAFADLSTFKSPAQLRDNLSDADDGVNLLSAIWNRITGYKSGTDYDTAQAAFATPNFTQGADTCSTTVCHNGNTATWSDSGVDCMYCHTSLPK